MVYYTHTKRYLMLFKKLFLFILLLLSSISFANEYKIAILANFSKEKAIQEWQPTIEYLNKNIAGHTFILIPTSFEEIEELEYKIPNKKIDFVLANPVIYVNLNKSTNISAILTIMKKENVSEFGTVIISNKNSNINSLEDIKGKTIATIAKDSFGAWIIPYDEILNTGIDIKKVAKDIKFLGSQTKSFNSILNGTADVALVRTGIIEKNIKSGKISINDINILNRKEHDGFDLFHSSELYPEWPLAKAPHISNNISKQVVTTLLQIKANSEITKTGRYWEWIPALSYESVHNILKKLKLQVYSDYKENVFTNFIHKNRHEVFTILSIIIIILLFLSFKFYFKKRILSLELKKFKNQSHYDHITKLYNLNYLFSAQKQWIHNGSKAFYMIRIDIDDFKKVNFQYSHQVGDDTLIEIAKRLNKIVDKESLLIRLDGAEFGILKHIHNIHDIDINTQNILNELKEPYELAKTSISINPVAGIVIYPTHSNNIHDLLNLSDKAVYQAKNNNEQFTIYEP